VLFLIGTGAKYAEQNIPFHRLLLIPSPPPCSTQPHWQRGTGVHGKRFGTHTTKPVHCIYSTCTDAHARAHTRTCTHTHTPTPTPTQAVALTAGTAGNPLAESVRKTIELFVQRLQEVNAAGGSVATDPVVLSLYENLNALQPQLLKQMDDIQQLEDTM